MTNSTRLPAWIGKALLGYIIVITPLLVVFTIVLRLHIRDLLVPYVLLLIAGVFSVLIVSVAVRYAKQAEQYSILLSLSVLVLFLSWILVCTHYGVTLAVFSRSFATVFLVIGFVGSVSSAIHVYILTYRHRSREILNQPPKKLGNSGTGKLGGQTGRFPP